MVELTQLRCEAGCGGPAKGEKRVPNTRTVEPPDPCRRRSRPPTDEEIEQALTGATSVRQAQERLGGIEYSDFRARCRAVPKLDALYLEAKGRGIKTGRARIAWRPIK